MKAPRCKICGVEHRLGPCPDTMIDKFVDAVFPKTKPRTSSRGSPVGGNPRPHGESLQQGAATSSTISTDAKLSRRTRDAANVAKPQTDPASAPRQPPRETKKKPKKRVTKSKPSKRAKKRRAKPKPRKPMPAGGLHPRVGRPKAEHVDCTLAAVQPWLDLVPPKSRSTYFRRKRRERLEKAAQ